MLPGGLLHSNALSLPNMQLSGLLPVGECVGVGVGGWVHVCVCVRLCK